MKKTIGILLVSAFIAATAANAVADNIYVVNSGSQSLSIIDSTTNAVTSTVALPSSFSSPFFCAVTPQEDYCYVTHSGAFLAPTGNQVSVVNLTTTPPVLLTTIDNIGFALDGCPRGIDISPDGNYAFTANYLDLSISVIDTNPASGTFNTVVNRWDLSSLGLGSVLPFGLTINPVTGLGYVACLTTSTFANEYVVVFDTAAASNPSINPIVGTITIPPGPGGVNQILKLGINSTGTQAFMTSYSTLAENGSAVQQLVLTPPTTGSLASTITLTPPFFSFNGAFDCMYTPNDTLLLVTLDNSNSGGSPSTLVFLNPTNPSVGSQEILLSSTNEQDARGLTVTRDSNYAYVALSGSNSVSVINIPARAPLGPPVAVGTAPIGVYCPRVVFPRLTAADLAGSSNTESSEKCLIGNANIDGAKATALGFIAGLAILLGLGWFVASRNK